MEKVFASVVAGAETEVVVCARALLDFIYYASFTQHSTESIDLLKRSLAVFHDNKDIFLKFNAKKTIDFNFPKLHALLHYAEHIKRWGSLDGYNTEVSERLHIDFAKVPYRRTNRKDYVAQQVKIMNRQESLHFWTNFVTWAKQTWPDEDYSDVESDTSESDAESDYGVDGERSRQAKVPEDDDAIRMK